MESNAPTRPIKRVQERIKFCSKVLSRWDSRKSKQNEKNIASKIELLKKMQEESYHNAASIKNLQEELDTLLEQRGTSTNYVIGTSSTFMRVQLKEAK